MPTILHVLSGRFQGSARLMSEAMALHAIDNVIDAAEPGSRVRVGFLGGEPFLKRDCPPLEEVRAGGPSPRANHSGSRGGADPTGGDAALTYSPLAGEGVRLALSSAVAAASVLIHVPGVAVPFFRGRFLGHSQRERVSGRGATGMRSWLPSITEPSSSARDGGTWLDSRSSASAHPRRTRPQHLTPRRWSLSAAGVFPHPSA